MIKLLVVLVIYDQNEVEENDVAVFPKLFSSLNVSIFKSVVVVPASLIVPVVDVQPLPSDALRVPSIYPSD